MSSREQSASQTGQYYVRPLLVAYGSVTGLTAAGSQAGQETSTGGGGCSQNSRTPCRP